MSEQDFSRLEIFNGMDCNQVDLIRLFSDTCHIPGDTLIFEQGQPAEALYILICGQVRVEYKPYDGPKIVVAQILPGGVFGWSSALGRKSYTSSAIAIEACETVCISQHNLRHIFEKDPATGGILISRLSGVISERNQHPISEIEDNLTAGLEIFNGSRRNPQDEQ